MDYEMNYTIFVESDAEFMTKYLCTAEVIAEIWDPRHNVYIVDNATGEVLREYPMGKS